MKRIISLLSLLFIICLSSCGSQQNSIKTITIDESEYEFSQEVFDYVAKNEKKVEKDNSTDEVTLDIEARGTVIVFKYQHKEKVNSPELKEQMEKDLNNATLNCITGFEMMQKEEPCLSSLLHEYYDANGELITSRAFKSYDYYKWVYISTYLLNIDIIAFI